MATTSVPTDLAVRLRLAGPRAAGRLRQEAGGGLSPTLTAALATIDRHGPLTPSELAERERIRRPAAPPRVARRGAGGLVGPTADPTDRRSSLLAVTSAGHILLSQLRTRKDA